MSLKFGTSGVRGLVTEMTDLECYRYALAYGRVLTKESSAEGVILAGDYRNSTPRIMSAVKTALESLGLEVIYAGKIPTPAIAYAAMQIGYGAIMVTGSHIPEDRNGIKFYMPWGEILKKDEQKISAIASELTSLSDSGSFDQQGYLHHPAELGTAEDWVTEKYLARYLGIFPSDALHGKRLVVYQHSTVLRTILCDILVALGAEVITVGWSDTFIPVDTEAVEDPVQLSRWVQDNHADALLSADGDGDRPLMVDGNGQVIRGDVLGVMAARALNASYVATPVSCNTQLEKCGWFIESARTRIGSPFVIEAMNQFEEKGQDSIVGYEANGGFFTGSDLEINQKTLTALPTRDAILPMLMTLLTLNNRPWEEVYAELPARVTDSLLLRGVDIAAGKKLLADMQQSIDDARRIASSHFSTVTDMDTTDGVRLTLADESIVHFRPSGNAPEFRAYVEAVDTDATRQLIHDAKAFLVSHIA